MSSTGLGTLTSKETMRKSDAFSLAPWGTAVLPLTCIIKTMQREAFSREGYDG